MTIFLADCSSLFQLGFGLNLAVPTLISVIDSIETGVTSPYDEALRESRPEEKLDGQSQAEFHAYVMKSHTGLRRVLPVISNLPFASILAAGLSAYLLTLAAVHGKQPISEWQVWAYVWVVMIGLPASYWLACLLGKWITTNLPGTMMSDPTRARRMLEGFDLLRSVKSASDDLDESFRSLNVNKLLREARREVFLSRLRLLGIRASGLLKLRRR